MNEIDCLTAKTYLFSTTCPTATVGDLSIDDDKLATFGMNNDVRAGMGDDHRMTP